jgi:hypothetical protein
LEPGHAFVPTVFFTLVLGIWLVFPLSQMGYVSRGLESISRDGGRPSRRFFILGHLIPSFCSHFPFSAMLYSFISYFGPKHKSCASVAIGFFFVYDRNFPGSYLNLGGFSVVGHYPTVLLSDSFYAPFAIFFY